MRGVVVLRFGPFELDSSSRQLSCGQKRIRLSVPQSAVLAHLVSHPGVVVSKETLIEAGWGPTAVTDNSLEQVISRLRKVVGDELIETIPHQGYRFTGTVHKEERPPAGALAEQLAPFRAFVQGRTDLYSLGRDRIQSARHTFSATLRDLPDYADAHAGLAMACGLLFEASTADAQQDTSSLELGIEHVQKACELAPDSPDAWITLAFVFHLNGDALDASAAARQATVLEPENWQHWLLTSYVSWGEERLRGGRRVLSLRPDLALGHWLRATVFIARGTWESARRELQAGCAAQDAQPAGSDFAAVGLHLLHGLVLAADNQLPEAEAELRRELAFTDSGQVYARECAANTWYALGAVFLRQQKRADAEAAFTRALTINQRHVPAAAALRGHVPSSACGLDAALGHAIVLARGNRHAEAARVYRDALEQAHPGSAGWQLPAEPLLHPLGRRDVWSDALALVRTRAS